MVTGVFPSLPRCMPSFLSRIGFSLPTFELYSRRFSSPRAPHEGGLSGLHRLYCLLYQSRAGDDRGSLRSCIRNSSKPIYFITWTDRLGGNRFLFNRTVAPIHISAVLGPSKLQGGVLLRRRLGLVALRRARRGLPGLLCLILRIEVAELLCGIRLFQNNRRVYTELSASILGGKGAK